MDIVYKINMAVCDLKERGLNPDVLVLGNNEAKELREMCSQHLCFECEDINGWEYEGLKVAKVDFKSYIGVTAKHNNMEELQA